MERVDVAPWRRLAVRDSGHLAHLIDTERGASSRAMIVPAADFSQASEVPITRRLVQGLPALARDAERGALLERLLRELSWVRGRPRCAARPGCGE